MKKKIIKQWCFSFSLFAISLSVSELAFAQNLKKVTGTVVEGLKSASMAGVSVSVKNGGRQTLTDQHGKYSIEARDRDTLVFRHIGSVIRQIPVGSRSVINVTLVQDVSNLSEVLVIGYGTVKKGDLTGSVGQVNITDMIKAPVASFAEALAGRVAGVRVSAADGQPGIDMDIVIRGANSLTQSNAPLYVIDGFPIEDFKSASLNPADIESINILKDASATAVYGSRAANGVIVIETKQGKAGAPVITINSSLGFGKLRKQMEVMSPYEFLKYQIEYAAALPGMNQGLTSAYFNNGETIESYRDSVGINWQDQVFRTSPTLINSVAIRGGTAQTKYSISASIFDQDGIIINSGFNRYQARLAIDQVLSKKLKVGINANYGNTMATGQQVSAGDGKLTTSNYLFYTTWSYRPAAGNGIDLIEQDVDPLYVNDRLNPRISSLNDYTRIGTTTLLANAYLNYSITKDLVFKVIGSSNNRRNTRNLFYNSLTTNGRPHPLNVRGINGSLYSDTYNTWSNENTITYNKSFNKEHQLNILGGFSLQGTTFEGNGFAAENVPNESLGIQGLDEGTAYLLTSTGSGNRLMSYFSRFNYNYKSKYLFTATIRGDASSKFAPDKRWGYFPSAAFAWNMSKESFMKQIPVINQSKLRLSWGITGNNRVGDFSYLPQLALPVVNSYSFNNGSPTKGTIANSLANADLKWESTVQYDIGYDLGLFNNRIEFTFDWYDKTTHDLLLNADIPFSTGFGKAFKNIGTVRNRGLEFSLNTINFNNNSFKWTSSFNISFNQSKILKLTTGKGNDNILTVVPFQSEHNMPLYIAEIGQPAGMFYGLIFDGIYQYSDFDNPSPGVYTLKATIPNNGNDRATIKPGDIKYKDINDDKVVNSADRKVIGNGNPKHMGGFSNNFSYKGFDLNVFLQWSYGNQIYNANRLLLEGNATQREYMNQFTSYINRWSPENQTNENFRANGQGPRTHSSRVLEDGSYLRLKTLSFAYNIPEKYIKHLYLKNLNINVSAQNLMTLTNYSGMDPETSARNSVLTPGFDFSAYPQAKTIVFGINATF